MIGFTGTATFQLWLNCAQDFAKEYAGIENPAIMQTYYSMGSLAAIIITTILVNKIKGVRFLVIYPAIAAVMIASSLSNYTILSLAGTMDKANILLMNLVITVIGVILAVYVNFDRK